MRTLIIVAICVAGAVGVDGQPSPARSPTSTSCAAAKNLSVVQAWSTDFINVKENVTRQECHFTVNGSPGQAGMGASASVPDPATAISQPGWTAGGPVPVRELARLLDGSSTKPEPGLASNLDKYASQVRECFAARIIDKTFRFDSEQVVCAVSQERFEGSIKVGRSAGVNFTTSAPHLRLGVAAETTAHYLFVPTKRPQ